MPVELQAGSIDLREFIRAGDSVIWSQGPSEPLTLTQALIAQRERFGGIKAFIGSTYSKTVGPEHGDHIRFVGLGAVGNTRKLLAANALEVIPCHVSQFERLISSGDFRVDVALVQLSQDGEGRYSFGAVSSYMPAAIRQARVVIAEVNDQAPWTASVESVEPKDIDYFVRTSVPLLQVPSRAPDDIDRKIAGHVAGLVPDGAVLQIGIGTLPDAVLTALGGHRELGIHSGIVGDGVVRLIEGGVVTNAAKKIDRGISVTGGLFGSEVLNRFAHKNPRMRVDPMSYTHSMRILAELDNLVSINSALEVDLFGQINSEIANGKYVGTIGGLTDFVRGTQVAPGGRSIVALSSRVSGAHERRIVPQLSNAPVTAVRADADFVVTEYGVAALRGQTVRERARRLTMIAHPDDRESLDRASHELLKNV